MQTTIVSLQFALFFKDLVERPDLDFSDINVRMLNIFDAIPTTTPIPKELPPEIPMIYHRSESSKFLCNIARNRIDFFVNRTTDNEKNNELVKDFNIKTLALCDYVITKKEIVRFGMIGKYFIQDNKAVDTIKGCYFNNKIPDVSELSLRFNESSDFLEYKINDIVEISSASIVLNLDKKFGIYVQRDINNAPKEGRKLDIETLKKISIKYSDHFDEVMIEELIK
jgi:hypothetical protein